MAQCFIKDTINLKYFAFIICNLILSFHLRLSSERYLSLKSPTSILYQLLISHMCYMLHQLHISCFHQAKRIRRREDVIKQIGLALVSVFPNARQKL